MPRAAIVQSVFESAIREINALEQRIVQAEDDVDDKLWEQARQVVAQLNKGMKQRDLAAQWINVRTGEEYSQMHVWRVKQVFDNLGCQTPRPRFRDAYQAIAHAKPAVGPPEPEPFHWINAVNDLRKQVTKAMSSWPQEARPLAPKALRDLAESLEGGADVSRGNGDDSAVAGAGDAVANRAPISAT